MSYRYMRVIVMFDLPVATASDRREYTHFRKYLIKNGFLMMQESIYCKLAQNSTAADLIIQNIRKNIVGEKESEVLDSDERIVIL